MSSDLASQAVRHVAGARLSSRSSEARSGLVNDPFAPLGVIARCPCFLRLRGTHRSRRLRVPPTPANPRSRGRPVQPCGCTPTGRVYLPRLFPCRGSASHVSGRIVHGLPPFRGFSPPVAAGPSRVLPSSLPFPTLRCRGSEEFSVTAPSPPRGVDVARRDTTVALQRRCRSLVRMRSPAPALFTPSMGRSSPGRSPLRGWPPGLVPHFCGTPLMGFYRTRQPSTPLRSPMPSCTCALQSVREPEV
jgi:hypothetical protein